MASYNAPFRRSELVGFFTWRSTLTKSLSRSLPWLYHACHEKQYRSFERRNELYLRSTFEVTGGRDDCDNYECVWTSLQPWHETHGHNHFGPLSVQMPMSVLEGRRFYVFERQLGDWHHYYLVQRQMTSSLFGHKSRASAIQSDTLFQEMGNQGRLHEKELTQYEVVLTTPVDLADSRFIVTAHNRCVPRHCGGTSIAESKAVLKQTVDEELRALARRFPQSKRRILGGLELLGSKKHPK